MLPLKFFGSKWNLRMSEQPRRGVRDENVWSAWTRVVTSCYMLFIVPYNFILFLQICSFTILLHPSLSPLLFPFISEFSVLCFLQSSSSFLNDSTQPPFSKSSSPLHCSLPTPGHAKAFSPLCGKRKVSGRVVPNHWDQMGPKRSHRTRNLERVGSNRSDWIVSSRKGSTEKADWVSTGYVQKYSLARADGDKHKKANTTNKT